MTSTPDPRSPAEEPTAAERVPRATTPTWEIELLIAGAVVFALLQLPGAVDAVFDRTVPKLSARAIMPAIFVYIYVEIVLYALICTFIAQLAIRGYWVALIGMRSVYPEGIRWDKLRYGPLAIAESKRRTPPIDVMVERADNAASLVFGFGALLVVMSLYSGFFTGLAAAIAWIVCWLLGIEMTGLAFGLSALVMLSPTLIATLIDRHFGPWPPDDWRTRALRGVFRTFSVAFAARTYSTLTMTFTSNVGQRLGTAMMVGSVWLLTAVVLAGIMARRGAFAVDEYGLLPDRPVEDTMQPRYYANLRGEEFRHSAVPMIPREEIRGDWLRLFVPYSPERHPAVVGSMCPEVATLQAAAKAAKDAVPDEARDTALRAARDRARAAFEGAMLECFAKLADVRLDGASVPVEFLYHTDSASGLRGAVTRIPVRELSPGRHEVRVAMWKRSVAEREDPPDHVIPFWR